MELIGHVNNYDWGKLGNDSLVAQLAAVNNESFVANEQTPYSELWMGSHPNGKSVIKSTGQPLNEPLAFLFKVLSIRKALSIQIHPNREQAMKLYKRDNELYKDSNHKPELAIALTPFVGLCGFRPIPEIVDFLHQMPCLRKISLNVQEDFEDIKNGRIEGLRAMYQKMMKADLITVGKCIDEISEEHWRLLCKADILEIFNKLKADFPNDVGVLSIFFLNVVRLEPGEAMFLDAGQIHAYLSGDCIECMACSDNVIRAGLTPKFKDLEQLFAMVDYTSAPPNEKIFQPQRVDEYQLRFTPPVDDFAIIQINLPATLNEYSLAVEKLPAILLVLSGKRILEGNGFDALPVKRGSIIFIPTNAGSSIKFTGIDDDKKEEFIAFLSFSKLEDKPE